MARKKVSRKASIAPLKTSIDLLLEAAARRAKNFHQEGRYEDALQACLQAIRISPRISGAWTDAAINCLKLERWELATEYAEQSLKRGGQTLSLFDCLSHAYGALGQWALVAKYGLIALQLRDQRYGGLPQMSHVPPQALPPQPSPRTKDRNVIAFALFGGNSKYCETAVLNALDQPEFYPYWICRFYIDQSVPESVIKRLLAAGAQVVTVEGDALNWPGPMWRFLALADESLHRVIFRDADSVISRREAEAVEEWVQSDRLFHAMRDAATHTELLLAGLWGAVIGALPPLETLIEPFFQSAVESEHFADQYFLRQHVWPYARQSLMQHDSHFGFLDPRKFPSGPMPPDFHVGYAEGSPVFKATTDLSEGTLVYWSLMVGPSTTVAEPICRYPARVSSGLVTAHIPARFAKRITTGELTVRIEQASLST